MTRIPVSKRRAAHVLGIVLLVALVAPFVVYAVPGVVGAEHSFVVLSGSMEPALDPGDVVIVDAVRPEQIRAGDVITFTGGGAVPTTHRVVGMVEEGDPSLGFVTKGDANEDTDAAPVPPEAILGRTTLVIPLIGHVVVFAGTQYGFFALVALPVALLVLNEVWAALKRAPPAVEGAGTDPAAGAAATGAEGTGDGATAIDAAAGTDAEIGDGAADPAARTAPSHDHAAVAGTAGVRSGYAITPADLVLTTVALGVLVPYSGWMTYANRSVVSAMVFAGALIALVLLVAVRVSATRRGVPAAPAVAPAVGRTPDGGSRVEFGSMADLVEAARAGGKQVVTDADEGSYFLSDGVLYAYRPGEVAGSDGDADPTPDSGATDHTEDSDDE